MTEEAGDDDFCDVGSVGTRDSYPHHSVEEETIANSRERERKGIFDDLGKNFVID